MGHVEVSRLTYVLPDGRPLLDDVSFRIGEGAKAALVGPNGAGKTTLLRLVAGELSPADGVVSMSGGLGVMPQFVGSVRDERSVRDLLLSVAPERVRSAAGRLERAERALGEDEASQLAYAEAINHYSDVGGYDLEVVWDTCTTVALGLPYDRAKDRPVGTLSGGEQKRLVLEALLRGPDDVLLLDEPDNYLDVPGKQWLADRLTGTSKTVLLVSHDGSFSPTSPTASSPWRARTSGCTAAASPPTRRHAGNAPSVCTSCAGDGTRSTPGSGNWCTRCGSAPPTTTPWRRPIRRRARG